MAATPDVTEDQIVPTFADLSAIVEPCKALQADHRHDFNEYQVGYFVPGHTNICNLSKSEMSKAVHSFLPFF